MLIRHPVNLKRYTILVLIWVAVPAFAYISDYGPFPEGAAVERIKLTRLAQQSDGSGANLSVPKYIYLAPDQKELQLVVTENEEARVAEVLLHGKTVLQPTEFSNFFFRAGLMAYSADLNRDGTIDFIIYSNSSGCGLACGYCDVAFILSSGGKYACATVLTMFPDDDDFILFNGKPHFIHTSLLGVGKCNDGKHHNFWIYNLIAFEKGGLKLDNSAHEAFPKTVWFTFKPNHTETTIITDGQKAELREKSQPCMPRL